MPPPHPRAHVQVEARSGRCMTQLPLLSDMDNDAPDGVMAIATAMDDMPSMDSQECDAIVPTRKHRSIVTELLQTAKLGAGLFADSYDLFVVDSVLAILTEVSKASTEDAKAELGFSESTKGAIAAATSFGAVAGMLLFGCLSDTMGRRKLLVATAACVMCGCVGCALTQPSTTVPLSTQLILFRVLVGVGIGGEYPLSAASALESHCRDDSASDESFIIDKMLRTARLFCMQGAGMVTAGLVALSLIACGCPIGVAWRVLVGLGALPASIAMYTRITHMKESEEFLRNRAETATLHLLQQPKASVLQQLWALKWLVLTTSTVWFLLDVTFYGTGQFRSAIEEKLFHEANDITTPKERLVHLTSFSLIVALAGLPGYLLSAHYVLKRLDVWLVQLWGFAALAVLYLTIGCLVEVEAPAWISLGVFGVTFFVTNLGPNMTTFIIPPMMFPTSIRTTAHGISAAAGKLGAAAGGYLLPVLLHLLGLASVMYVCGAVALAAMLVCMVSLRIDSIAAFRAMHHTLQ